MPRNMFPGEGIAELKARRASVMSALSGGSQTHVGIEPGVFHEFKEMTRQESERQLQWIDYALWLLDPDTYENPYTGKRMVIHSTYG